MRCVQLLQKDESQTIWPLDPSNHRPNRLLSGQMDNYSILVKRRCYLSYLKRIHILTHSFSSEISSLGFHQLVSLHSIFLLFKQKPSTLHAISSHFCYSHIHSIDSSLDTAYNMLALKIIIYTLCAFRKFETIWNVLSISFQYQTHVNLQRFFIHVHLIPSTRH